MQGMLRFAVPPLILAGCFLVGTYAAPVVRMAQARLFPEPEFRTGDYSAVRAAANAQIVLFSTSTCPFCEQARKLLAAEGVSYRDFVVDQSAEAREKFAARGGGPVPLIYIGDREIRGFRETTIRDALRAMRSDRDQQGAALPRTPQA